MSQCQYGACPTCQQESAQNVPCTLDDLHDGDHYCANGHWYPGVVVYPAPDCTSVCEACPAEFEMSSFCNSTLGEGHTDPHTCANGHSWS